MAKPKGNMFDKAQAEREQSQADITSEVTGKPSPDVEGKGERQSKITLSISEQDKIKVKVYAAQHKTTISELLHVWIAEHCNG